MISAARLLGLAAACVCAALFAAGAGVEPATAQGDVCKADVVTTSGRAKLRFRAKSKEKELEGDGAAKTDAIAKWERQVADSFGNDWKQWSKAKDTTFDCEANKARIVGTFISCTVSGRPCLAGTPKAAAVTKEDRDDDARRDRKGSRFVSGGRGPGNDRITRYEDIRYERAMERQRWIEAERKRRETAHYEREMARQKHLAEHRRRAETAAWERENARQRYLEERRKRIERWNSYRPEWDDYDGD
jgi:hypothetical protein